LCRLLLDLKVIPKTSGHARKQDGVIERTDNRASPKTVERTSCK